MALPFRADILERPIVQYQPQMPPFLPPPRLVLMPEIEYLRPQVATMIANEIGVKSYGNPARVFMYNQMSGNNWQNQDYGDVIDFTMNMIAINIRKGIYRTAEQGIGDAVSQATTMFASKRIFEYPEIKGMCAPQVVDAAMQNLQLYNNLNQEINSMNRQPTSFPNPGTFQPNPTQPHQSPYPPYPVDPRMAPQGYPQGYDPRMVPQGYPQGFDPRMVPQGYPPVFDPRMAPPGYQAGYDPRFDPRNQQYPGQFQQAQAPTPGMGSRFGVGPSNENPISQTQFFDRHNRQPSRPEVTPPPAPVEEVATEADWAPSASQPYKSLINPDLYEKRYSFTTDSSGSRIVMESIVTGDKMDREKHAIMMLGDSFKLDGVLRQELVGDSAAELANIKSDVLEAATVTTTASDDSNKEAVIDFVYPNWFVDPFLESAIFEGKVKQKIHQKNHEAGVYRYFVTVAKPVITKESHRQVLPDLAGCKNFATLAKRLYSIGATVEEQSHLSPMKEPTLTDMVMYCNQIEMVLTDLVNDFLKNKLSLSGLKIDSFVEDINDVRKYLETKYSTAFAAAYDRFELEVCQSGLFQPMSEETEAVLTSELKPEDTDDVIFTFIPVDHSITYIGLLDRELNFNVGKNDTLLIREAISPVLFKIAESLYAHKKAMGVTLHDLLVTSDNVVYKLHKGYLGFDSYLISRA